MKRYSLFLLTLFWVMFTQETKAQNYNINSLKGKTWQAVSEAFSQGITLEMTFFSESLQTFIEVKEINKTESRIEKYYLSDTIEDKFDPTKAGKSNLGKYIIRSPSNSNIEETSVYEIISLSNSELCLRSFGTVGTSTITFKAK